MEKTVTDLKCPEALAKEIATFSLPRRIAAPFCIILFTSFLYPLVEETYIRGGLQDFLLKQKLGGFFEKHLPSAVEFWNSKKGKCIRVAISTAVFSLLHVFNSPMYPLYIMPLGLAASILQEEHGLAAALGVHLANNFVFGMELLPHLFRWYLPSD